MHERGGAASHSRPDRDAHPRPCHRQPAQPHVDADTFASTHRGTDSHSNSSADADTFANCDNSSNTGSQDLCCCLRTTHGDTELFSSALQHRYGPAQ